MNKYTIEVLLKDLTGYESTTMLFDLSYLELLETYALISALKYHETMIYIYTADNQSKIITIEEFIISKSAEKVICELN